MKKIHTKFKVLFSSENKTAKHVTMYEKLYVKGGKPSMDSRDTKEYYKKREPSKPTYKCHTDTSALATTCIIVTSILFGVMLYEVITELYI